MYEMPKLERYGSFRELTLGGGAVPSDGFTPAVGDGCAPNPDAGLPGEPAGECFAS